tara:strand:- start:207 stop:932 length:726 start_codon:yes stop_codon:yes gene_type:complete
MAKIKPMKKFVTRNLSEAIERSVNDAVDSGVDISELVNAVENEPTNIIPENNFNQEDFDELVSLKSKGISIPGQSLTNDPNAPYDWEKPAKYANPREALTAITSELLESEKVKFIIASLAEGMSVTDITTAVLYAKFFQGEINPDTMLLLIEPIMYTIMSLGSEAGIEYNIEPNDVNEEDEDEMNENLSEFKNAVSKLTNEKSEEKEALNIRADVLPRNLLDKIKEQGPEIRSLLTKQTEE